MAKLGSHNRVWIRTKWSRDQQERSSPSLPFSTIQSTVSSSTPGSRSSSSSPHTVPSPTPSSSNGSVKVSAPSTLASNTSSAPSLAISTKYKLQRSLPQTQTDKSLKTISRVKPQVPRLRYGSSVVGYGSKLTTSFPSHRPAHHNNLQALAVKRLLASAAARQRKKLVWDRSKQVTTYCSYFCRTGRCPKLDCKFIHDKDKVAVCPR